MSLHDIHLTAAAFINSPFLSFFVRVSHSRRLTSDLAWVSAYEFTRPRPRARPCCRPRCTGRARRSGTRSPWSWSTLRRSGTGCPLLYWTIICHWGAGRRGHDSELRHPGPQLPGEGHQLLEGPEWAGEAHDGHCGPPHHPLGLLPHRTADFQTSPLHIRLLMVREWLTGFGVWLPKFLFLKLLL